MGKRLAKHKRGTQYSLHSSCGCLNFTLWKDGASGLFANNDFDSSKTELVTSKINDRRKKEYHGIRSYEANEAVRCYRDVHNNVDIHNQCLSYGHWDYRTRRKQMRVSIITLWLLCSYVLCTCWDRILSFWLVCGGKCLHCLEEFQTEGSAREGASV